MPMTKDEQLAWQKQAYGCLESEMRVGIEDSILVKIAKNRAEKNLSSLPKEAELEIARAYGMVAMSLLSDAQELIELGSKDEARQYINRAKYIIATYWMRKDDA